MADPVSKKSNEQELLEKKAESLKTIISNLAPDSPRLAAKKKSLEDVNKALAATQLK